MAFFAVVALVVLGLGLVVFGIVALRDEPPRWMLRFRHPGRILALGLVVLLAGIIANMFRYDIAEDVEEYVGSPVSCKKVGVLDVEGETRDVYACVATQRGGAHVGCFARVGDGVVDVTRRAETPGAFPGGAPDC